MIDAAKQTTPVFPLAALRQFAGNSHQGHRTASTTFRPGAVLAISNTVTAIPASCYDSASSFTVVGNNPLSYTDPSGMFEDPVCVDPISCGISIGVAVGTILCDIFCGGGHTPSLANFPFPNQFPSASPSGGPLGPGNGDTSGPFGSGNTGQFVFSFGDASDEQAWDQLSFFCRSYGISCSAADIAILTKHPIVFRGEIPIGPPGSAIESVSAEAEKLYPKLAGKFQLHHVIPKYLGGPQEGVLARLPAAYHQLITNAFRTLVPYGQKIQLTAEEVERILQQVYSKYPIP